jgi:hypothetical protein
MNCGLLIFDWRYRPAPPGRSHPAKPVKHIIEGVISETGQTPGTFRAYELSTRFATSL